MNLIQTVFAISDAARVQDFHCGDLPHQAPLAEWIKTKASAQLANPDNKTKIWLYESEDGSVVGFGSLGIVSAIGDFEGTGKESKIKYQAVLTMAVRSECQGKGLSHQIMNHLEEEAIKRCAELPKAKRLLGLYVNPKNTAGVKLYKSHGFENFSLPLKCHYTGDSLQCMLKALKPLPTMTQ
jgi:ribosomal protein S18 acetylase RimI-like enzyme